MSNDNRRTIRVSLRTIAKINQAELEKLELLALMMSNYEIDEIALENDDLSPDLQRDYKLEEEILREGNAMLSADNTAAVNTLESIAKQHRETHCQRQAKTHSPWETLRDAADWCERNKIPLIGRAILGVLTK